MRKVAVVVAIPVAVILGVLALAPEFADLSRYRVEAAARATQMLGRDVTIAGPVSLSLLPSPRVIARDVRIANLPGGSTPDLARVRRVEVSLAVWPLLAGRIEATSARLIEPSVTLERFADRGANWEFATSAPVGMPDESAPSSAATGNLGAAGRPVSRGFRIDRLVVEDGTLIYRNGPTLEVIEHLGATVSGDAVAGPIHAEGTFTTLGSTVEVAADIGRFQSAEVPIALSLATRPAATLTLEGSWIRDATRLDGKLALKSEELGAASALLGGGPVAPLVGQHLAATSDVVASADGVALDHLSVDLGDMHGEGAVRLTFATPLAVDMRLSVNSFDVDRWLAAGAAAGTKAAPPPGNAPNGRPSDAATARLPAVAAPGGLRFALPQNVTAILALGADAIVWRKGVIRQARLEAALADGKLVLNRLSALLPGTADLAVRGTLDSIAALPRFTGSVEANAENLRELLDWLGFTVGNVPPDRLRRATLAGNLSVDGEILEARDVSLTLDGARITGAGTAARRPRLAFGARLAVDQLNLDAYLPRDAPAPAPAAAAPRTAAPSIPAATAPSSNRLLEALQGFDANLDAAIETMIWRGQAIHRVHFLGTLDNRDLSVREISVGDLGGASGQLTGFIQAIGSEAAKSEAAFDMRGPEFGRVLRLVAPSLVGLENYGAFSMGGEMQTQGARATVNGDLDAMGGKLHVAGERPDAESWSAAVALDNPSLNRLLRLVSPAYHPQGGELGPVKLAGKLERSSGRVALKDFSVEVGAMSLGGEGHVALGERPMLTANVTLGDVAIDKFIPTRQTAWLDWTPRRRADVMLAQAGPGAPRAAGGEQWSRAPLDLGFLKAFDADVTIAGNTLTWGRWRLAEPAARLGLRDAVLEVRQLAGKLFGGALATSGTIDASAVPSLDLKLSLKDADLKQALTDAGVSMIDGSFDVDSALAATGASPGDLIAHINGEAALKGRNGVINGINLPAASQRLNQVDRPSDLIAILRSGAGGATRFSSLDGTFKVTNGVARSDDLRLLAEGGEGTGVATVDFPNWTIASRTQFRLIDVPGAPPLGVALVGPLDQPRTVFDVNALEKFLVDRVINRANRSSPPPSDQDGAAPNAQPAKPSQMLRDLLKGLKPPQ